MSRNNGDKMSDGIKEFQSSSRLEAFSDGVFAIVITLLVLELAIPELKDPTSKQEFFQSLSLIRNKLLSYALCFLFIGQLWVSHTNLYKLIRKTDMVLFWLNNVLLMCACLFPFIAGIIGDYPNNPGAIMMFGFLYTSTGVAFCASAIYCVVNKYMTDAIPQAQLNTGSMVMLALLVLSVVPIFIADKNPSLGLGCYFAITLGYIAGQRFFVMR